MHPAVGGPLPIWVLTHSSPSLHFKPEQSPARGKGVGGGCLIHVVPTTVPSNSTSRHTCSSLQSLSSQSSPSTKLESIHTLSKSAILSNSSGTSWHVNPGSHRVSFPKQLIATQNGPTWAMSMQISIAGKQGFVLLHVGCGRGVGGVGC